MSQSQKVPVIAWHIPGALKGFLHPYFGVHVGNIRILGTFGNDMCRRNAYQPSLLEKMASGESLGWRLAGESTPRQLEVTYISQTDIDIEIDTDTDIDTSRNTDVDIDKDIDSDR